MSVVEIKYIYSPASRRAAKKYRESHRAELRAGQSRYYQANKQKVKERNRKNYLKRKALKAQKKIEREAALAALAEAI